MYLFKEIYDYLFSDIIENSPNMIWISDLEGNRVYFNRAWLDFTGRNIIEEQGTGWTKGVYPGDYLYNKNIYNKGYSSRTNFEVIFRLQSAEGDYRWVFEKGIYHEREKFKGFLGYCSPVKDFVIKGIENEYLEIIKKIASKKVIILEAINDGMDFIITDINFNEKYLIGKSIFNTHFNTGGDNFYNELYEVWYRGKTVALPFIKDRESSNCVWRKLYLLRLPSLKVLAVFSDIIDVTSEIGDKIKVLRKQKKLQQIALAKKAGISQSYLSNIENGEKSPTIRILNKISEALGLSLIDFLKGQ
jgi:PAS domain S-box-containing protein